MELQKLKCFVAVADKLSFTRAAEELYFSVPTVTHHIKSLEEQMGVQLLFRDKHSVRLTPRRRDLLSGGPGYSLQTGRRHPADLQERDFELLRIGCTSHAEMVMLTSVFTRFRLRYPNILPDIQIANFDQILDLFEDRTAQSGLCYRQYAAAPPGGLSVPPVLPQGRVCGTAVGASAGSPGLHLLFRAGKAGDHPHGQCLCALQYRQSPHPAGTAARTQQPGHLLR